MTTFNAINNALPELTINSTTTVNGIINSGTMSGATTTNLSTSSAIKTYADSKLSAPGSALVYITKQVASSSSILEFNGNFSSSYLSYMFLFLNILPATNNVQLYTQLGTGGTPTYITANYVYNNPFGFGSSPQADYSDSDSKVPLTSAASGGIHGIKTGTTSCGVVGCLTLYGFNGSSTAGLGNGTITYLENNAAESACIQVGFVQPAATFTAIKFYMSTGNIASGTIYMYGMKAT